MHEYEGLYYLERELAGPDADEVAVRRAARRKYMKRILSMPDPLRYRPDPRATAPADPDRDPQRTIVNDMKPDQQALLDRKIGELFALYGIPRLGDLHLTRWATAVILEDGLPAQAVVRIANGRGTYGLFRNNVPIGQGSLSDVAVSDTLKDTVEGHWTSGNSNGFFRWTFGPGQTGPFVGAWGHDPQNGPVGAWRGQRTAWED